MDNKNHKFQEIKQPSGLVEIIINLKNKVLTRTDTNEEVNPGKSLGKIEINLSKYDHYWKMLPLYLIAQHAYVKAGNYRVPKFCRRLDDEDNENYAKFEYFLDEGCAE